MGLAQREWAAKAWRRLIKELGGKCVDCGRTRHLELDCIEPTGHWHHRIEWSWRISFYRRQREIGNLAVRCKSCNASKGNRRLIDAFLVETPF